MDTPDRTQVTSLPKGSAKGTLAGFSISRENNPMVNLILLLLVISTNRSPAVAIGGRNGIHHCRRQTKLYK